MSGAWSAARVAWAVAGVLTLAAGAAGVYLSLPAATERDSAPVAAPAVENAFVFRAHSSARPLPDIAFEDAQGRSRTLAEFGGKVVLLNLWATWCTPCREEMPALDGLQQKLGGPDFEVIALSIDAGGVAAVRRFYDEVGVRALAIYVDPAMRATGSLGAVGVPTTLLIDRQGREIGRRTGPAEWDGPEAVRLIASYAQKR
ncbi:MAG: TlpA family protein disulfide reductase [Betaproteobacteria bacterium]|nr:TlpA family protein disulfide reductase [Betaproteobacteria bacterium]